MKNKYGIFDSNGRKIVGLLNIEDGKVNIEINGSTITLAECLRNYNGCDIVISVGSKREELIQ